MPRGSKDGSITKFETTRFVNGKRKSVTLYDVRKRWVDSDGRLHEKKRRVSSLREATKARGVLEKEVADELNPPPPQVPELTFDKLATWYEKEYLIEPQYAGSQRVAGLKSHYKLLTFLKPLCLYFNETPIRDIKYESLRAYKQLRLKTPTRASAKQPHGHARSITSVNRELQLLRRILNCAIHQGWLTQNPFSGGDSLINMARETKRMRILTRAEASALVAACVIPRDHLRLAVVWALETAMRWGEQRQVLRKDIDLEVGFINVRTTISKTEKQRLVGISEWLKSEIVDWWEKNGEPKSDERIFTFDGQKRSFATACRIAGIEGFRWHDLRHTGTTWMLDRIHDSGQVMKVTGHDTMQTFLRYVNLNPEMVRGMVEKIDAGRRVEMELKQLDAEKDDAESSVESDLASEAVN